MARGTKRNGDLNAAALRIPALRLLAAAVASVAVVLAAFGSTALGASTHPFQEAWSTGPNCSPNSIATDAQGNVYVYCVAKGANGMVGAIRKFSPNGTPIPFTANVSYVSGNEINENPFNTTTWLGHEREMGETGRLAIDRSSVHPGYIYFAGGSLFSQDVYVYAPSGEYVTSLKGGAGVGEALGVGVDQNGFVYVDFEGELCGAGCTHISKYDPHNFHEIERLVPSGVTESERSKYYAPCCGAIRPDNTGAFWINWGGYWGGEGWIGKVEADQWTTNLKAGYKDPSTVIAENSPYLEQAFNDEVCPDYYIHNEPSPVVCAVRGWGFDVDIENNDLYANDNNVVTPYSEGRPGDPVHQDGPSFGEGILTGSLEAVALDLNGNVYVTSEPNKVVKFARGFTLPTVTTKDPAVADIGHVDATVRGEVDPDGGGAITACRVVYGPTKSYGSTAPCNEATPYPDGAVTEVSAQLTGLEVGHTYHYKFEASNAHGWNMGGDHLVEARAVLDVETKPATQINRNDVTLQGQLQPDGMATEYWFEYGNTSNYTETTLDSEGKGVVVNGAPGEVVATPALIGHLQEGRTYHYRLVARNALGTTKGQDVAVKTASPPEITGLGSDHVTEGAADLHALVNPNGYATTYTFEYGTTIAYDHQEPVSGNELNGTTPQAVEIHLSELTKGTTIHYRLVATNSWGTTTTDDTTLNFRPPNCPNAHVRQITGSSYLPDCRAYELVSPGYAGAVDLLPGETLNAFYENFALPGTNQSPQNQGYASNPSRLMFLGSLGSIDGIDAQNSLLDTYMSTRTTTGWVTTEPGLKGSEEKLSGGRICSDDMAYCVDHPGPLLFSGVIHPPSNSPFLYKADGTKIGRLPTNVNTVPGGTSYRGDEQLSGDFSHYFFSTQTRFTPDGLTSAPGSVYDNDIAAKTVTVVSKDASGDGIQAEPSVAEDPNRVTGIVGASTDGSRVLMAGTTSPYCSSLEYNPELGMPRCPRVLAKPVRLYERENDAVTYEVSRGAEVLFAGMTRDARTVYFTSTEQLLPQDEDTSSDLYRWSADGDALTLVSQEGALGNTDDCSASWVDKCGVKPLQPKHFDYSEVFEFRTYVKGIDDVLASGSGDIYFFSPEDLVPGEVGGDGQRNLYLFRNGHLHLVSTLEPDAQIERSTISDDGSHAAFLTKSSLTPYDAKGKANVYSYNANADVLRCASCNPEGTPPIPGAKTVAVSESGPFMANDGRTFFSTKEALAPADTDGIRDVYEYVEGRPQLITSGTGYRDNNGGMETTTFFFGHVDTGLEAVSRNGTDVFFTTFESLAPQDQNGEFIKFYDARAGGGFDVAPDLGPCAAADECHGAPSDPGAEAEIATGGTLGAGGNLPAAKPHRAKHHRKKHHKKRHHKRSASNHQRSHRNG